MEESGWDIVERGEDLKETEGLEEDEELTLLGKNESRKEIQNELQDIEIFLENRIYEMHPSRDPESF